MKIENDLAVLLSHDKRTNTVKTLNFTVECMFQLEAYI